MGEADSNEEELGDRKEINSERRSGGTERKGYQDPCGKASLGGRAESVLSVSESWGRKNRDKRRGKIP